MANANILRASKVFSLTVILLGSILWQPAKAQFGGLNCPGRWVSGGGGQMCLCPNGTFANYIGGRVVCSGGGQRRRTRRCNKGFYVSGNQCIRVGHKRCGKDVLVRKTRNAFPAVARLKMPRPVRVEKATTARLLWPCICDQFDLAGFWLRLRRE